MKVYATKNEILAGKILTHLQRDENGDARINLFNKFLMFICMHVLKIDVDEFARKVRILSDHPEAEIVEQ